MLASGRFRLAVAVFVLVVLVGLFPFATVYDDSGPERIWQSQSLVMRHDPGAAGPGNWFIDDGAADMSLAATAAWLWVVGLLLAGCWAACEAWPQAPAWLRTASMVAAPMLVVASLFLFRPGLDLYFGVGQRPVAIAARSAPGWLGAALVLCTLVAWSWDTRPLRTLRRLEASPAA